MPIAAIPNYLGKRDLSTASPGMRFGMYLPIWTARADQEQQIRKMAGARSREGRELKEILDRPGIDAAINHARQARGRFPNLWEKNPHAANQAWGEVARLSEDDRKRMAALADRQSAFATATGAFTFDAQSTAPFTTGLGNEHPLENGFAFLWPYGLPYLPGSGVKGVLRQAARELAPDVTEDGIAKWDIETDWSSTAIDALFGKEDSNDARRGALTFWDVIPKIKGDKLMVEVMTGHQSHYYMNKQTPHDSGQPIPVNFLTVPPGSGFTFHVVCDQPFLHRIAPELEKADRWKALLQQAFEHAFEWLGFGAKTAVGYGAMQMDAQAQHRRKEQERLQQEAAEKKRRLAERTASLPEDAAWLEGQIVEGKWADTNVFLNQVEKFLEDHDLLSEEALKRLSSEMESRWKGIMSDPNAVQGKKKKPKYKPRPIAIATRLLAFKIRSSQ